MDQEEKHDLMPLFAAIGMVASAGADLEYRINSAIWALASVTDEDGACLTSQFPSMIARMRALIALVRLNGSSDELARRLNAFTSEVDALIRQRNRVIHDPWFVDTDTNEVTRLEITADRRLVRERKPHDIETLRQLSDSIHDAANRFSAMRQDIAKDIGDETRARLRKEYFDKFPPTWMDHEDLDSDLPSPNDRL
jgi:hypothetical protein